MWRPWHGDTFYANLAEILFDGYQTPASASATANHEISPDGQAMITSLYGL
jgi:hypothetical protein